MRSLLTCFILAVGCCTFAQNISADELLNRTIAFHDPNGQWTTFNDSLHVVMTTPDAAKRNSAIYINLPSEYFSVTAEKEGNSTFYEISKDACQMRFNNTAVDDKTAKDKGMSCERAKLYKNYYSYLYGLPMKLKDPGTNINYPVERKTFKGKDYLVLKATYDASVGKDIWYFYFNPESYAMEIYQFYKTDASGNLKPESGEYILLEELLEINEIKMPKIRSWYYNKNDELLGVDSLVEK